MLFLVSTAIVWGLALTALPPWWRAWRRRRRQPGEVTRRLWLALTSGGLALCFTLLQPPIYGFVDRATGVPNAARLLANLLAVGATWCVNRWLAIMPSPALPPSRLDRLSRSPALALAALIALAAFWFAGPRDVTEVDDYVAHYGTSPAVLAYRLVFSGYLGLTGVGLCRRVWAYRQAARRPLTRAALGLQTVGWASAVFYLAHEGGYAVMRYLERSYSAAQAERAQGLLLAGAMVPLAIGRAFPHCGTRLLRLQRWFARYRAYRQIEALARALPPGTPAPPVVVTRGGLRAAPGRRDLDVRLHFRIMVIRDGATRLSERITPTLLTQARQYAAHDTPAPDPAALDGACLALALGVDGDTPAQEGSGWQLGSPTSTDLTSEARYLSRVARAWHAVSAALATPTRPGNPSTLEDRCMNTPRAMPRDRLARALTEAFAPTPVAIVALSLIAWHSTESSGAAIRWALLAGVFAPVVPRVYLAWQVRRGAVTDVHVHRREQRPRVLLISTLCVGAGVALLAALGAPPALIATLAAAMIGLGVALAITLVWKISLHVGILAGVVVALTQLVGPPMLALAPLVPAVAWARVQLRAHTPAQVLAGGAIGALVTIAALSLLMRLVG